MADILVVEDEWILVLAYEVALEAAGHTVVTASNGSHALARARARAQERPFDLIVTDYMMPQLDGFGFLRELRRLPGYEAVPVILATAISPPHLPAAEAGLYQATLVKPFRDEALLALIADLLRADGPASGAGPSPGPSPGQAPSSGTTAS